MLPSHSYEVGLRIWAYLGDQVFENLAHMNTLKSIPIQRVDGTKSRRPTTLFLFSALNENFSDHKVSEEDTASSHKARVGDDNSTQPLYFCGTTWSGVNEVTLPSHSYEGARRIWAYLGDQVFKNLAQTYSQQHSDSYENLKAVVDCHVLAQG